MSESGYSPGASARAGSPPGAERRHRVLLAGTAGGVGTTTVAALLFAAAREQGPTAPVLLDHTAGTLGQRLDGGDQVPAVDQHRALHDVGPLAAEVGVSALADPDTALVLVSAATPHGCRLAAETVEAIREAEIQDALIRTVLVVTGVFAVKPAARTLAELNGAGLRAVLQLASDPALAVGGRIVSGRLSRSSRQFGSQLLGVLPRP